MKNMSILAAFAVLGCAPGYMKASELDSREQGPQHCETRCHELGMKMGALVLVGDSMPGCVCQPRVGTEPVAGEGASGATVGHVVMLAAAAEAQRQQEEQRRRQQEQYKQSTGPKL